MANDLQGTLRDPDRLRALRETGLLNTAAEEDFDRLTRLAAFLLHTPTSMISLVGEDRQVCKSCFGLPEPWASRRELPIAYSYCQYAITLRHTLVIPDARQDPRVKDSPAARELGAIAYAGVPLITPKGYAIGTLCVIDTRPHAWPDQEIHALEDLAGMVMTQIELRAVTREEARQRQALRQSEARYRALFDDNPVTYLTLDPRGRILAANRFGARLLGYEAAGLRGRSLFELVDRTDEAALSGLLEACLRQPGALARRVVQGLQQGGGKIWLDLTARSVPAPEDGPMILLVAEDVTEQRAAERRREEADALVRATLESVPDGILAVDVAGRVVAYNQRFAQLWTIPISGLGKHHDALLEAHTARHLADPAAFLARVREIYAHPEEETEDQIELRDGRILERRSQPQWVAGRVIGRVWSFRDVTARRRAEAAEQRLHAERTARAEVTAILERITDAFVALDRQWRLIYVNGQAARLIGREPRELLGKNLFTALPGARRFLPQARRAIERREPFTFEEREPKRGIWLEIRVFPSPEGLAIYFRDVTPRKEAERVKEEALAREAKQRALAERAEHRAEFLSEASRALASSLDLQTTLETLTRLVIPYCADWCIVDILAKHDGFRRAAVKHVDPSRQEPARALREAFPPDPTGQSPWAEAVRRGVSILVSEVDEAWLAAATQDAEHRRLVEQLGIGSYLCVPLVVRNRVIGAVTLIFGESGRNYDADDLAFAEDLMSRAAFAIDNACLYAEAGEAIEARNQVLAVVSHDLKNPLNLISTAATLLIDLPLPEEKRRQQVEIVRRSADRMGTLIRDLLDAARIEAGGLAVQPHPIPVETLVEEVWRSFAPLAQEKGLQLTYEVVGDPPPVLADPAKIQQVFSNLIGNAIKFTDKGTLTLRASPAPEGVQLSVSDEGPGIPAEHLPHVFDRYWQAEGQEHAGSGLGLAIAKGIVEAHGGRIWVESQVGVGSTFHVVLPAAGTWGDQRVGTSPG